MNRSTLRPAFPLSVAAILVLVGLLGGRSVASAADDLQALFAKMRENIPLYDRIEAHCTRELVLPQLPPRTHPRLVQRRILTKYRVVFQGDRYYDRCEDRHELFSGKVTEYVSESGYDGEFTRINSKGQTGNIDDRRVPKRSVIAPHHFGVPEFWEFDLPDVLEVTDKVQGELDGLIRVENRIVGQTTWKGLRCVQVESIFHRSVPTDRWVFTIAPDRNYLVVRSEHYLLQESDQWPWRTCETDDWRQLAPGGLVPAALRGTHAPASGAGRTRHSRRRGREDVYRALGGPEPEL